MVSSIHSNGDGDSRTSSLSRNGAMQILSRSQTAPTPVDARYSSRGSSVGVSGRAAVTEAAKAARKKFLAEMTKRMREKQQQQASVCNLDESTTIDGLEHITQLYSRRRWNWVFMDFAQPVAEEEFRAWVGPVHHHVHLAARASALAVVLLVFIAILIEGTQPLSGIPWWCWSLLALALVCCVASLALARRSILPLVDTILSFATGVAMIVACGLLPYSVLGNDVTYLHALFSFLCMIGTVEISWFTRVVTCMIGFTVPCMVLLRNSIYLFNDFAFLLFSHVFEMVMVVLAERGLRQQFLEEQIALFYSRERERMAMQQRVLLETVVPAHIIDDLMTWMSNGLDPSTSIARVLPEIVIAFVKLSHKGSRTSAHLPGGSVNHHDHPPPHHSILDTIAAAPQTVPPSQGATGVSLFAPQPLFDVNADDEGNAEAAAAADGTWIIGAHGAIDSYLERFPSVSKIKTVGDIVMIAGPLVASIPLARAVDDMMGAVSWMRCSPSVDIQAGIHVGEAVAAVLGTTRLAFDVFGDVVNTASRVMSGAQLGDVAISAEAMTVIDNARRHAASTTTLLPSEHAARSVLTLRYCGATQMSFGPPENRVAKGKAGGLTVYVIQSFPIIDLSPSPPERSFGQ